MPKPADVVSHWHHTVVDLQTSAADFYRDIELAIKMRQVDVTLERIVWNEGGMLSGKREYLRVEYSRFVFDISAFPFGRDFCFSYWHGKRPVSISAVAGCLGFLSIPVVLLGCLAAFGVVKGTIAFLLVLLLGFYALGQRAASGQSDFVEWLTELPIVGTLAKKVLKPTTYYSEDTRLAFADMVQRVVQDVIAGVLTIKGMTPLTPEERAPKTPRR